MAYIVKEIFYSLQGEGAQTGRPAVFVRFAGCNLWSGREEDREKAICRQCDTDFVGTTGEAGGEYKEAHALAHRAISLFPLRENAQPYIVCTGGEPLLQVDSALIQAFHDHECAVAIETNGTMLPPAGIDWICVSPKTGADLVLKSGNELKLLFPQENVLPDEFLALDFKYFFLQPLYGPRIRENIEAAVRYCLEHPTWRLSLQMHKILGIK